jgi:RNA polymerase sigma-70 factor (ECF subfamily)
MTRHGHDGSLVDVVLLENVCDGCGDCFALLFRRHFRQVFSIAYKILRDQSEAEDILQEVFLAIFLRQERFDPARGSVKTWILQFAYFKSLLRRRYLRIRNFYKFEEISQAREIRGAQSLEIFGMNSGEWARYVEAGIAALNAKQRRMIELIHFEGYTLQESADIERESLANTRNHYYRGLKALRVFLRKRSDPRSVRENMVLKDDAYGFES